MIQNSLDQLLGFLVNDVSRLMRTRFDSRARDLGLTRPQWRVLVFLARSEGINQSGLAEIIEVERMTLGRMIDRLEVAGLVERRPDASDRRVHRLYLSEKARPLLDEMVVLANELQDEALDGLSDADRNTLRSLLTVIKNNLSARQSANDTEPSVALLQAQAGGMDD
jgi:MarR family transcriptional regulator for hemolysin